MVDQLRKPRRSTTHTQNSLPAALSFVFLPFLLPVSPSAQLLRFLLKRDPTKLECVRNCKYFRYQYLTAAIYGATQGTDCVHLGSPNGMSKPTSIFQAAVCNSTSPSKRDAEPA